MDVYIKLSCPFCKDIHSVKVDSHHLSTYRSGALAQDAFPSPVYTAVQRESMISGLCPNCQRTFFGSSEEGGDC